MRTTFDLNDALLDAAKRLAIERRTSLKALVEDGLRAVIGSRLRAGADPASAWPVSYDARPVAGVDLTRSSDLLERAEEPT